MHEDSTPFQPFVRVTIILSDTPELCVRRPKHKGLTRSRVVSTVTAAVSDSSAGIVVVVGMYVCGDVWAIPLVLHQLRKRQTVRQHHALVKTEREA